MIKLDKSQIAIGNYHYVSFSFDYFLDSVQKLGIKNIELWGAKPHFCVDDQDQQTIREIKKQIDDRGLKLISFCPEQNTYPIDISCRETRLRQRSVDHMVRAIETGALLGSPTLLVCPGNGYMDEPLEAAWARCRESLLALAAAAQSCQMTLVLETQSVEESNFLNNVHQQKKMIDEVGHPNLKAMLDTVQMAQFDRSIDENIRILGSDMKHVHLGNTLAIDRDLKEQHIRAGILTGKKVSGHIGFKEGNLPLEDYLLALAGHHYQDYVTIEICQRAYFLQAEKYAREAFETISQYLA